MFTLTCQQSHGADLVAEARTDHCGIWWPTAWRRELCHGRNVGRTSRRSKGTARIANCTWFLDGRTRDDCSSRLREWKRPDIRKGHGPRPFFSAILVRGV